MNYQKFIRLVHKGCQEHIKRLNKTSNFKNRLYPRLNTLHRDLSNLEVKKYLILTDKIKTLDKIEKYFKDKRENRRYTFSDSNVTRKITDQLDVYNERFYMACRGFLGDDPARKLVEVIKAKANAE